MAVQLRSVGSMLVFSQLYDYAVFLLLRMVQDDLSARGIERSVTALHLVAARHARAVPPLVDYCVSLSNRPATALAYTRFLDDVLFEAGDLSGGDQPLEAPKEFEFVQVLEHPSNHRRDRLPGQG